MNVNIPGAGRLYRGERTKDHVVITVHEGPGSHHVLDDDLVDAPLGPADRDDLREFDWGRPTPGSERLAAALLGDALSGTVEPGLAHMLADEIVVELAFTDPWVLWTEDIQDWARRKRANLPS